jgi:hypothetical protein
LRPTMVACRWPTAHLAAPASRSGCPSSVTDRAIRWFRVRSAGPGHCELSVQPAVECTRNGSLPLVTAVVFDVGETSTSWRADSAGTTPPLARRHRDGAT